MFQILQFAVVAMAILYGVARYRKMGIANIIAVIVTMLCSAFVSIYIMNYDAFNMIPIDASRLLTMYHKLLRFFSWAMLFAFMESFFLWCLKDQKRVYFCFVYLLYFAILLLNGYGILTATHESIFGIYSVYLYRVSFFVIAIAGVSYFFAKDSSGGEREGNT